MKVERIPVYARRAIETGNVWKMPPCVSGNWNDDKLCPAHKGLCSHAQIVQGSIKNSYWAQCNAKKKTLKAIATYKFLLSLCTDKII